jgi:hypothetical protein
MQDTGSLHTPEFPHEAVPNGPGNTRSNAPNLAVPYAATVGNRFDGVSSCKVSVGIWKIMSLLDFIIIIYLFIYLLFIIIIIILHHQVSGLLKYNIPDNKSG